MGLYKLKCMLCGKTHEEKESYTRCLKCGGPLDVSYDYDEMEKRINFSMLKSAPLKASKYLSFMPIMDFGNVVTLDEGGTPLYRCRNLKRNLGAGFSLYAKNEGMNPTGAFKDRGTMVEMTKGSEMDAKAVCCASTGNMASSVSAYASVRKTPCYVLVPDGTPIGKLAQTLSYGARVLQIKGNYDDASRLTEEMSKKHGFMLMGDYAFRVEGQKSGAFEICEQMGWRAPDYVIVPMGVGTNISAIWKGFKEFKRFGLIEKLPRMVGVQAKGCPPIVDAHRKKRKISPVENPDTIASAIMVGSPIDGVKALRALEESRGMAISVSDDDMLEAQQVLAKSESIFAEPSSAASVAAVMKLKSKLKGEVVFVLTGNGLKDPASAIKGLSHPPSVEPKYEEVEKFIEQKLYNLKSPVRGKDKSEIVFRKKPKEEELRKVVKKSFDITLGKDSLERVNQEVDMFIEKGKKVSVGDLKFIIEETLGRVKQENRVLVVHDFRVESSAHEKPESKVEITFKGKEYTETGTGDGPVDATINAIRKALRGFDFSLTDYHVTINTGGTEAVVNVTMTLVDERKNKVVAKGTSPDIVVASVKAFEAGYNILCMRRKGRK